MKGVVAICAAREIRKRLAKARRVLFFIRKMSLKKGRKMAMPATAIKER